MICDRRASWPEKEAFALLPTAMMTASNSPITHYETLRIAPSSTSAEVKEAYHRVLLSSHPDKQTGLSKTDFDIAALKEAYLTLSDPVARAAYDASLSQTQLRDPSGGPRPAQVISFDEFVQVGDGDGAQWTHDCRCGGTYAISEADLERDTHLVACERCSEVIYIGYELVDEGE